MARVTAAGGRGRRTLVAAAVLFAALAAAAAEPAGSAVKFTVTSTADEPDAVPGDGFCRTTARECTLRAAVQEANATGVGGTVVLTAGAVYTLTRTGLNEDQAATGDLDLTGNVTITVLSGRAVVQGASGWFDRVFDVSAGSGATLHALDVMGGHPSSTGGGIRNKGGTLALTDTTVSGNSAGFGAGIDNGGTLTLSGSAVSGNSATSAAGILNSGTLSLTDSTVADNAASSSSTSIGGGILNNGGALTLTNSTISGNSTSSTSNVTSTLTGGGGIFNENAGAVTLTNSIVAANSALGLLGRGGGIVNDLNPSFFDNNTLTLTRSTIRDNQAQGVGGGIFNSDELTITGSAVRGNSGSRGGGIANSGTATVTSSAVSDNGGGGLANLNNALPAAATLTVANSTISDNQTAGSGGGIENGRGTVTVTGSTISGNSSSGRGVFGIDGGGGISNGSTLNVTNSTISTNTVADSGGGILNFGTADLKSVTIAKNVADSDANAVGAGGGIYNDPAGTLSLGQTIVGDNADSGPSAPLFPDCAGTLQSNDFNLVENTNGCTLTGSTAFNVLGRDPRLGPLQPNGGLTDTHALLESQTIVLPVTGGVIRIPPSPAIDAGNPLGGLTSQNGVTRPQDGNADGIARNDIGAFELGPQTFRIGTWALAPAAATARPGQRVTYDLTWTVPPPRGWRSLDTLQVQFADDQGTALWIRFQEVPGSPGTFAVVDPKNGKVGPSFAPGRPNRLESNAATLYLSDTSVDGPPGNRVTLRLALSFKPSAAGHTYDFLVLATDDAGETQGFHRAGSVTVTSSR